MTNSDVEVALIDQDKRIGWLESEAEAQFNELGLLLKCVRELAGVVKEMCEYHPEYTDLSKRPEIECDFCDQQHDDYIEHVQAVAKALNDDADQPSPESTE
jgi:hypothetical protein